MPMTGYETKIFGAGSDHSVKCATTSALSRKITFY